VKQLLIFVMMQSFGNLDMEMVGAENFDNFDFESFLNHNDETGGFSLDSGFDFGAPGVEAGAGDMGQ